MERPLTSARIQNISRILVNLERPGTGRYRTDRCYSFRIRPTPQSVRRATSEHPRTALDLLARNHGSSLLLRAYSLAIGRLLSSFEGLPFRLLALNEQDLRGIATILAKYEGLGIQLADASLAHLANREGIETIFTLDRPDFSVLRLARGRKLRVTP